MGHVEKRTDTTGKITWHARWRDPAGADRKATFPRKVDAERHIVTVESHKNRGSYIDPRAGRVRFRDYAEQWRASQPHRATTAKAVEQHLRCYIYPVLGSRPLSGIRPSEIQPWATGLSKKLAPSTHRTVSNTLKAVFKARRAGAAHHL